MNPLIFSHRPIRLPAELSVIVLVGVLVMPVISLAEPEQSNTETTEPHKSVSAKPVQTILLKDGTVIKGKLIGVLEDEYYVIETPSMGKVKVLISDLQGMSTDGRMPGNSSPQAQQMQPSTGNLPSAEQFSKLGAYGGVSGEQMMQMQQSLMNDPEVMAGIQSLMQDPEVMKLIQNGNLLTDLLTMDPSQMQNNENLLKLMGNPNMQALMEKVQQKVHLPESNPNSSPSP